MRAAKIRKSLPKKAIVPRRRAVALTGAEHVRFEPLSEGAELPVVARPTTEGVDLRVWLNGHREEVHRHQLRAGGVLFRGFAITDIEEFGHVVREFSAEDPALYRDATTPRRAVQGNIYTSTEYPADQSIFFHS
ncbi:MAG: TauD/TfdA family dioxygenase, partial [Acidobacteriota bacterium]